jgi:hypothetical protein
MQFYWSNVTNHLSTRNSFIILRGVKFQTIVELYEHIINMHKYF